VPHVLGVCIIYKGNLTFARKNYFLQSLIWMVEGMNGEHDGSGAAVGQMEVQVIQTPLDSPFHHRE
jgi:hypothetical protein